MTIDLAVLASMHKKLQEGKTGITSTGNEFIKIEEGTTIVRILPAKTGTDFYSEVKTHRVQLPTKTYENNVVCLGDDCPICNLYRALWKTGNKDHEDLARKIKAKSRYYLNVLDRNTLEVKVLSCGTQVFQKILATILDQDFGDITDPQTGFDFKLVKVSGDGYPNYNQSGPRPKTSVLGSPDNIAKWMSQAHDLTKYNKAGLREDVEKIALAITPITISESS
jgi:hypothetical protein